MPIITNLQNRTHNILDEFIQGIADITLANDFQRARLLKRTKKLFDDLDKLGIKEFAKVFTECNFSSDEIKEDEKYREVLNCLVTLVIEKYPQSDLLCYFLPKNLSKTENRPEYSSDLSKIIYWFQLIGYWLRLLRNKPRYELGTENNPLAESLQYIKDSLRKQAYTFNDTDDDFRRHLHSVVEKIEEKAIRPSRNAISRKDYINNQTYHQTLLDKSKELNVSEKELAGRDSLLTQERAQFEEEKEILAKATNCLELKAAALNEKEQENSEREKMLKEKEELLTRREKTYKEKYEGSSTERASSSQEKGKFKVNHTELNNPSEGSSSQSTIAAPTTIFVKQSSGEFNQEKLVQERLERNPCSSKQGDIVDETQLKNSM